MLVGPITYKLPFTFPIHLTLINEKTNVLAYHSSSWCQLFLKLLLDLHQFFTGKQTVQVLKWYMKCLIYWAADFESSKLWSSQLWTQFTQLRIEGWKSQDFNGVWTHDLAIPVRRTNQLSYEATDVGSWSFVSSNEPVKNGCEVTYEMFHILNCGFGIK